MYASGTVVQHVTCHGKEQHPTPCTLTLSTASVEIAEKIAMLPDLIERAGNVETLAVMHVYVKQTLPPAQVCVTYFDNLVPPSILFSFNNIHPMCDLKVHHAIWFDIGQQRRHHLWLQRELCAATIRL